jgi:hypothetical protein
MPERNDDAIVDLEILVELFLLCFVLKIQLVAEAALEADELIFHDLRLQLAVHELDALCFVAPRDRPRGAFARPVRVPRAEVERFDSRPVQESEPWVETLAEAVVTNDTVPPGVVRQADANSVRALVGDDTFAVAFLCPCVELNELAARQPAVAIKEVGADERVIDGLPGIPFRDDHADARLL